MKQWMIFIKDIPSGEWRSKGVYNYDGNEPEEYFTHLFFYGGDFNATPDQYSEFLRPPCGIMIIPIAQVLSPSFIPVQQQHVRYWRKIKKQEQIKEEKETLVKLLHKYGNPEDWENEE